jgi:hypothetical protein
LGFLIYQSILGQRVHSSSLPAKEILKTGEDSRLIILNKLSILTKPPYFTGQRGIARCPDFIYPPDSPLKTNGTRL